MDRTPIFRGKRLDNGQWVQGYHAMIPTDSGEPEPPDHPGKEAHP